MYIRTDDNNNIVELIVVGVKPEINGYEVDSIPEDILRDILNYKYINGEFIKPETDSRDIYIDDIRRLKIENMSSICHSIINAGIDYNDEHYSLTTTDQINLMKLESVARFSPETPILYHPDGKECRVYTNEEIISIATMGIGLITFHTTYFNQLKSQINNMSNVDDILNVRYGMKLDDEYDTRFKTLTSGIEFPLIEMVDTFDYESIIPKVDQSVIDAALRPVETPTIKELIGPIIEPWKPSTQPFVREEELIIKPFEPTDFPIDEPVDEEPTADEESGEIIDETDNGEAE